MKGGLGTCLHRDAVGGEKGRLGGVLRELWVSCSVTAPAVAAEGDTATPREVL